MRKSLQSPLPLAVILIAAILPVTMLTTAHPAEAKPFAGSTEPVVVVVSHRDLDLTNQADVAVLDQRIASSVKRACPVLTRNLKELSHARQCRKTAAAHASAKKDVAVAAAEANRPHYASASDPKALAAQYAGPGGPSGAARLPAARLRTTGGGPWLGSPGPMFEDAAGAAPGAAQEIRSQNEGKIE
jgi:UrcA family protein